MLLRILVGCSFMFVAAWAMPVAFKDHVLRLVDPERTSVANGPGETDVVEKRNVPDLENIHRDRAAKVIRLNNGENKILKQLVDPPKDLEIHSLSFEKLEARNGNRYNPLIDRRDYTDPSKRYTFEELEAANANRYNRLIDVQGLQ